MDWTQAIGPDVEAVFAFLGIMATLFVSILLILLLSSFAFDCARGGIARMKRMRKTTRALRCDKCDYKVVGRCARFGHDVVHAPVRFPGCSWGIEEEDRDG